MSSFESLIPVGKKLVSRQRTITEDDFMNLVEASWANAKIHSDREYAGKTQFGERILPGYCTLACVMGLCGSDSLGDVLDQDGLRRVAMLELEKVTFSFPVHPNDTIHTESEILDFRITKSNPKRAILRIKDVGINQDGKEVLSVIRRTMVELVA